jgi:hypothetical protein
MKCPGYGAKSRRSWLRWDRGRSTAWLRRIVEIAVPCWVDADLRLKFGMRIDVGCGTVECGPFANAKGTADLVYGADGKYAPVFRCQVCASPETVRTRKHTFDVFC